MSLLTLQKNTDFVVRTSSFVRGSGHGVVSGLQVQQVPQSMELQVTAGEAVVNGCVFTLPSLYNNLVPGTDIAVVDGLQVLVCLKLNRVQNHVLSRYQQRVVSGSSFNFSFTVVKLSDYVPDPDVLVLGVCRYSISLRDTAIGSDKPVQLPLNVLGIYADLPTANTALFNAPSLDAFTDTDLVKENSSVIVSTNTGTTLSKGTMLTAYKWAPVQDPTTTTFLKLALTGTDVRENLTTLASTSSPVDGFAFKVENSTTSHVTFNARNTAYMITYTKPALPVVGGAIQITVRTSAFRDPVTVTGTITATTSYVALSFDVVFPGSAFKHTFTLSWDDDISSTPLQSVDGLWSNVAGAQVLSFSYYTLGYILPSQRFTWSLITPEYTQAGFDSTYYYSVIGVHGDVDMTQRTYAFVRPLHSGVDTIHRSKSSLFASVNNAHGTGFNDVVGYGKMPIHKQLFDSGFGIASMKTHGIVGELFQETVAAENIRTDYFGNVTGLLGNRYIQLQHVPLNISSLVDATTGSAIPHDIVNDVVVLGPDFIGGDFRVYPAFAKTQNYAVGARVTYVVGNVLTLYVCTTTWTSNPAASDEPSISYFAPQVPVDVTCTYFYINDLEYSKSTDALVKFAPNQNDPIVTEGVVVEPTDSDVDLTFNLGQYKGIVIPKMTLSLASSGDVVSTEQVIDAADLSTRQASQPSLSGQSLGACQVKAYLTRTPVTRQLAPLQGHLLVTSHEFYGRVRLFYTYGVREVTVFSTTTQVTTFSEDLDLSSAQLLDGVNYIPRTSWEYSYDTKQVIIASDVYVQGRTYTLVRRAEESQRNQSGYVEVVGTKPEPVGIQAVAKLVCDEYGRLAVGDSITLSIPGKAQITKTLQSVAGYTGFVLGASVQATLQSLALALNTDPVFKKSGSVAYQAAGEPNALYVKAGDPGVGGNLYQISASSVNTSLQVEQFAGGVDHVWTLDALSGLSFALNDSVVRDMHGYFSVWSTGNLDQAASQSSFYRVDIFNDDGSGSIARTVPAQTGVSALSSANWTLGSGWSGSFAAGFTKQVAGSGVVSNSVTYVAGSLYRVVYTVTSRVSGSFKLTLGGVVLDGLERTGSSDLVFTKTTGLVIVPDSDFIGTVKVDVQYLADTYSTDTELGLTLQITGLDSEDNTLQETLVIDSGSFCDIQNHRIQNQYSNVRSKNLYSKLTSWSVLSSQNIGASQLTLVAETASGTRDLFDLCDLSWNGSGVNWLRDRRCFIDAYTNKPTSNTTAEALATVAALLQFQLTSVQGDA